MKVRWSARDSPRAQNPADLQETPAKWWALLTSYMNWCSRLTQLTQKAWVSPCSLLNPATKMVTCFLEGFRPGKSPCFSVFSALFDGHPSHQEHAQPGNGEQRGTRRLHRAFSPHLLMFTGEPEHWAFSKPPWPAAEEDNRLREG